MNAWHIAAWVGGIVLAIVGSYYAAQVGIRVAVARLEEKFAALERRVNEIDNREISVIKSQVADARTEIEKLRVIRHDVPGLKAQVGMLVALLSKYISLDRKV